MLIRVQFQSIDKRLDVNFQNQESFIKADFGEIKTITIRGGTDYYEGSYAVTPGIEAQTLETKDKFMLEDVVINEIPFYDVSNTAGGSTVYIGREI